MKYTLKVEDEYSDFKNEMTFSAVTIDEVFLNIKLFLRGTGFHPDSIREMLNEDNIK